MGSTRERERQKQLAYQNGKLGYRRAGDFFVKLKEAFRRDWWKLLLCLSGLAYAIDEESGVIAFFAIAALIAWPFRRLGQKDGQSNEWW
jgi:hypothetical protein